MEYKCRRVALNRINTDNTLYRISTRKVSPALVRSIETLGLINPPMLMPEDQGFTVVVGFSRIEACRHIGMKQIICRLIQPDAGPEQCARIAVTETAMQRELNLMEQANAVGLLSRTFTGEELIDAARVCGLSVNHEMMRKLIRFGKMPPSLQQAALGGAVALPIALQLDRMDDKTAAEALTQLFLELRFGLNRQREILDWIVAIARRDDIPVANLLDAGELRRLRMDATMETKQKGQVIRQRIREMRYPAITRHEAKYARAVKSLQLKPGTLLVAPAHFEGQTYSLRIDFQSYDELINKKKELDLIVESEVMKNLWTDTSG